MSARALLMAAASASTGSGGGMSGGGGGGGDGYATALGIKMPTLGASGATWPPAGWTSLWNGSEDDAYVNVPLASTFTIAGTGYTNVFAGSNGYFTFGAGSTNYYNLGASNPPYPKILFAADDNSYQRVATISAGSDYTRVRYEGTASTGGTPGSPNIVCEATFFSSSKFGGLPTVELLFGAMARVGSSLSVCSASATLASSALEANKSYVLQGSADGTAWTILAGYVSGVDY